MVPEFNSTVWYLMFLHHSQTQAPPATPRRCLVSSAFTSFSNRYWCLPMTVKVWYLMLLHHSQTLLRTIGLIDVSGILCFYIILKLPVISFLFPNCLVSYAFTSFSNLGSSGMMTDAVWYLMLLHHSQTDNLTTPTLPSVWYLMLLHHSQTLIS